MVHVCLLYIYSACQLALKPMQEFEKEDSKWMVFKDAGDRNALVVQ